MENCGFSNEAIIEKSYVELHNKILHFISSRINNVWDAENLAQDVWLRLLTYGSPLEAKTITSFIYTVARNLVNDYLRHRVEECEMCDQSLTSSSTICGQPSPEEIYAALEIAQFEQRHVECLPPKRRIIYVMSRYEDKSVPDIAAELSLSTRTVENHLRMGRHDIRQFISAIA